MGPLRYDAVVKRWAIRIAVFLLLGAIVNVAVACACAAWINPWDPDRHDFQTARRVIGANEQQVRWVVMRRQRPGALVIDSVVTQHPWEENGRRPEDLLPNWIPVKSPDLESQHAPSRERTFEARGWPALTLWCEADSTPMGGATLPLKPWEVGVFSHPRVIALRPIWPGFAINTLFYAAILWALFAVPFALRRKRRIKRGLCPNK